MFRLVCQATRKSAISEILNSAITPIQITSFQSIRNMSTPAQRGGQPGRGGGRGRGGQRPNRGRPAQIPAMARTMATSTPGSDGAATPPLLNSGRVSPSGGASQYRFADFAGLDPKLLKAVPFEFATEVRPLLTITVHSVIRPGGF